MVRQRLWVVLMAAHPLAASGVMGFILANGVEVDMVDTTYWKCPRGMSDAFSCPNCSFLLLRM